MHGMLAMIGITFVALGSTHVISWLVGDGCGPLTYRVEFPWVVEGFVGDQVVFRVRRVLDDREPPHAYTSPIEIESAVPTRQSSWSALRARYLVRHFTFAGDLSPGLP